MRSIEFNDLESADLIVDALYKGAHGSSIGNEPLHILLRCGTMGGFRYIGSRNASSLKYVVLYSSLTESDWPDNLDTGTGLFTYYGDNRQPGCELEETPRKGNQILRECFNTLHKGEREDIPPFFIFTKGPSGRDVIFKGLAVPGARGLPSTEDLVAIWKSNSGQRFQNYRAIFTVLDIPVIRRSWINDLAQGNKLSDNCPPSLRKWFSRNIYSPLAAEPAIEYRSKTEQLPSSQIDKDIVETVYGHFKDDSYGFESCASELVQLMDRNFISCEVTRPWVDGGRDAIGKYRIGLADNSINVDFALEAKCYSVNHGVGVKETSRLISRLKYRQFGIFVTTSYISLQAYKEIKQDQHPVIIISGRDIANILIKSGFNSTTMVQAWLGSNFPTDDS